MRKVDRIFNSLMGKSGYTLYDYLEHTGHGEYIRLPFHPTEQTNLVFRYSAPTLTEKCILLGCRNSGRTTSFYYYQNTNNGGCIFVRTGGGAVNFGNSYVNEWYEIVGNSPTWTRERLSNHTVQARSWDGTQFTVDYDLYLFAINHAGAPIGSTASQSQVNLIQGVKLSAMQVLDGSTLIMDLRPARRSDGRTGYLDILTNTFHHSETEYDFLVGNF